MNFPTDLPLKMVAEIDYSQLNLPQFASIAPSDQLPQNLPTVEGAGTTTDLPKVESNASFSNTAIVAPPPPPPPVVSILLGTRPSNRIIA